MLTESQQQITFRFGVESEYKNVEKERIEECWE